MCVCVVCDAGLVGGQFALYLFGKSLETALHPVCILDAVPMSHAKQHLEFRLGRCAPTAWYVMSAGCTERGRERERKREIEGTRTGRENVPISNQCQVFQTSDLIFLPSHAQQGAGNFAILWHGCRGDGLCERRVGLGIGGLDERPHERLCGPRRLGARCPCGNIDRVDDSFDAVFLRGGSSVSLLAKGRSWVKIKGRRGEGGSEVHRVRKTDPF